MDQLSLAVLGVSKKVDGGTHLTTKVAALHLGLSPRSLERWRDQGRGPACRRFGRKWLYHIDDLDDWSRSQRRDGGR